MQIHRLFQFFVLFFAAIIIRRWVMGRGVAGYIALRSDENAVSQDENPSE